MLKFKLFQEVILLNDNYSDSGVKKDAIGNIVEIWDDNNVEVDFCNKYNNFANIIISVSIEDISALNN